MSRRLAVLGAVVLVLGACGESAEEKAQEQVCDARADIAERIDSLRGLTGSTFTTDAVREDVEAIGDDLREIADARGDLSDERRDELAAANEAFVAGLREIGSTVLRSTSAEEAQAQLQAAVSSLGAAYEATLARFDCD
jgi:hypothetical protein